MTALRIQCFFQFAAINEKNIRIEDTWHVTEEKNSVAYYKKLL